MPPRVDLPKGLELCVHCGDSGSVDFSSDGELWASAYASDVRALVEQCATDLVVDAHPSSTAEPDPEREVIVADPRSVLDRGRPAQAGGQPSWV